MKPNMSAGPVVIVGVPDWGAVAEAAASKQGFGVVHYAAELPDAAILSHLVEDHAALLLVDGGLPAWQRWVVTPVTSPATRRIPLVLVTDDLALFSAAVDAGATQALRRDELEEWLPRLLAAQGRMYDAAHTAALARQCTEPLPPEGREAIRMFNAGEYYRQHDVFEALWLAETGPVRNLYRGILQIGVGYYHIQRGNLRGALKMLLRSVQWLMPLPDVCQGVDVRQLRADAAAVRLVLENRLATGSDAFEMSLLKPVRLMNVADDGPPLD